MYQISVEQHFDAAHYLRGYGGKCEAIHGHRFRVVATVQSAKLNNIGLAYDFVELKRHLEEIVGRLDHISLNEVSPFDQVNPSSENIATTIYRELQERLAGTPVSLASVQVWESPESCATYMPGD